jgi:transposase-like protein
MFVFQLSCTTVHNWVHVAALQPEDSRSPGHIRVDETVNRLNDEQYWLYAAVDAKTNKLLHSKLSPTVTGLPAQSCLTELQENHDVNGALFLINGSKSLQAVCNRQVFDFRYADMGIGTPLNTYLQK